MITFEVLVGEELLLIEDEEDDDDVVLKRSQLVKDRSDVNKTAINLYTFFIF